MIEHLVLTLVVLICFYLASSAINGGPFDAAVKWCVYAIAVIIAVVIILRIWGIAF